MNQAWEQARPPTRYTPDSWAEQHRYLSPEASELHGKWRNANSPHVVMPLQCLAPWDETEQVFVMWSSQSSKSEVLLNFVGYTIYSDPGPGLCVQPNMRPMGAAFIKDRIEPMIRDSPTLAARVYKMSSRSEQASTTERKSFPGGQWSFAGAASPAQLASRPIRYVVGDEIDRWPATKEGSAIKLVWKRTGQFSNRKGLFVSSPTFAGTGIHAEYQNTLQHEWQLSCLHCGESQMPKLKHFAWDIDDQGEAVNIRYACEHCGAEHDQVQERKLKRSGHWVCTNPGKKSGRRKGFWLNQWGVLRVSWLNTVTEWLESQDDPEKLQAAINTVLAEVWTGVGEKLDWERLHKRRELYPVDEQGRRLVPKAVVVLLLVVDTQDTWLDYDIIGYEADGRTSWRIERGTFEGDPNEPEVWAQLDELRERTWRHENGGEMLLLGTGVDSRGHRTPAVYGYCNRKGNTHCYALMGKGGWDQPVYLRRKVKLPGGGSGIAYRVGVDPIKSHTHRVLGKNQREPGYCHFPMPVLGEEPDQHYDEEYFQQLCGETLETSKKKGVEVHQWLPNRLRNEAFDLANYAYALLKIINPNFKKHDTNARLGHRSARAETAASAAPSQQQEHTSRAAAATGGSWMNRSRGRNRR